MVVVDTFSRNIDEITLRTDEGDVDLLVSGRPELLEVGQRYEIDLVFYEDDDEDLPHAFIDGDTGCGSHATTIRRIDDDGTMSDIEIPGLLPSSPISLRTFFVSFAGFVVLVAVFGRTKSSD
jgi:hypothetical protein